jgi:hypothetical protein
MSIFTVGKEYDHSKDRLVKGINFLTSLYRNQDIELPVGYQLITKAKYYVDKKTGKQTVGVKKERTSIFEN